MFFGALEAGGTKMVMAIGDENGYILERKTIPTLTPDETIPEMIQFFSDKKIVALGIGAFGPVDVVEGSDTYGTILNTPKLSWKQYPLLKVLQDALGIPVGLDTDVNGSCLGEMTYGCAKGLGNVIYMTVGTGIGVGIAVNGRLLHGMLHPEGGHILIPKNAHDPGRCICPYHDSCLEGLASGPSIEARWGKPAKELVSQNVVWELESEYLAKGLVNMILTLSPQKVILGGGVMHQEQIIPMIREKVIQYLNHYYDTKEITNMDQYIVPASLHDDQGILGALKLGQMAYEGSRK